MSSLAANELRLLLLKEIFDCCVRIREGINFIQVNPVGRNNLFGSDLPHASSAAFSHHTSDALLQTPKSTGRYLAETAATDCPGIFFPIFLRQCGWCQSHGIRHPLCLQSHQPVLCCSRCRSPSEDALSNQRQMISGCSALFVMTAWVLYIR